MFGQASSKPANHITNQTTIAKVDLVGCIDFTDSGQNLDVGYSSSRVEIVDYNNDGIRDLLVGNGEGSLLYYANRGNTTHSY